MEALGSGSRRNGLMFLIIVGMTSLHFRLISSHFFRSGVEEQYLFKVTRGIMHFLCGLGGKFVQVVQSQGFSVIVDQLHGIS